VGRVVPPLALSRVVLRPYALAHRPKELPVAAACILALAVVFVADVATPVQIAVSALGLIPLLVAMWLLSAPLALAVGIAAVGQLLVTGVLGTLSPVTVGSEVTAYVLLGLVCRLYAGSLAALLFSAAARRPREPGHPPVTLTVAGPRTPAAQSLTRRERQVARLAAQGYTAREIGSQLHIGKRTVETHLANAYDKLGVRSKRELVRFAGIHSADG